MGWLSWLSANGDFSTFWRFHSYSINAWQTQPVYLITDIRMIMIKSMCEKA